MDNGVIVDPNVHIKIEYDTQHTIYLID